MYIHFSFIVIIISAKLYIKLLLDKKLINADIVQKRSKLVVSPMIIGHLPLKIESNFSGLTEDQWQNWCLIYSPIVLQDAIPQELYTIWPNYVQACPLLCRRCIWKSSVIEADQALTYLCNGMEDYFGEGCCNITMHLHLQLNECALDFGPLYVSGSAKRAHFHHSRKLR